MVATNRPKPVILCVLDGWGHREESDHNAIALARTPSLDHLFATSPHVLLNASSSDVGLPRGQMGNSEVGHMNLGAGRVRGSGFAASRCRDRRRFAVRNHRFRRFDWRVEKERRDLPRPRVAVTRRCPCPSSADCRVRARGCSPRRCGYHSCISRWPRHTSQKRPGIPNRVPRRVARNRCYRGEHVRSLLCDGP